MNAKYDRIGTDYNRTRKADKFLTEKMLFFLNPDLDKTYLDIGCGTGNYTIAYHEKGYKFIGIDPSNKMLEKAKAKSQTIVWRAGTAEQTGLGDQQVDGITATLTIHHWTSLTEGLKELFRVLNHGGNIVIFTSTPKQMEGYWLNQYFPEMMKDSMFQMPSLDDIKNALILAGFKNIQNEKYFIQRDLEDKFLYCGKHNPEMYFDENIRQGISSFSSLANADEVNKGFDQLRQDINHESIQDILDAYSNEDGDYQFIKACKS